MSTKQSFEQLAVRIARNKVFRQYRDYRHLVALAIQRKTEPLQFVGGVPGIGKTYGLLQACAEMGIIPVNISPPNPHAFVRHLYEHRNAPVIVLDDANSLASSPKVGEVVRMAFGPTKTVIWSTVKAHTNAKAKGAKFDSFVAPPTFKVNTVLVWLSNMKVGDLEGIAPAQRESFKAICSRGGDPIWIEADDIELFRYTIWLGTVGNMFKASGNYISREAAVGAVNWFNMNRNHIRDLSPRTLNAVGSYFHKIPNGPARRAALGKKLSDESLRNIPGFNDLKMESPGVWKEYPVKMKDYTKFDSSEWVA